MPWNRILPHKLVMGIMSMGSEYVSELPPLPIVQLSGDAWAWGTMVELYQQGKLIHQFSGCPTSIFI
jgi:hypothetical protein